LTEENVMSAWKRIVVACVSLLALGIIPVGVAFAQVKVTAATPASAYQGTLALDVIVSGSGFNNSAKVQYFVSGTTNPGGIVVRKVTFRSSTELVTTIDVAETADLNSFDIVVALDSGRKGKGTTLFSVKAKPNSPPPSNDPPPTYPAARAWHAFTSNGGSAFEAPRLYMYGGSGSDWNVVPADLWFYSVVTHAWTLVTPQGTARPGSRAHNGLSCGGGFCLLEDGLNGVGLVDETWLYSEATNAWTQVTCGRRAPCPSQRMMVTMAFDPARGNHLLFGGKGSTSGLNDTLTFDPATLKWTVKSPTFKPSERNRAAALHVPGVGIVMHGGQNYYGSAALCDMYAWDGSNWARIDYDVNQPHPCLHSHDLAWDGGALVVTGGYVNTSDTPSLTNWRFTFASDGRSGAWAQAGRGSCYPIDGTDAEIHPGARAAYGASTATRVYFGGEMNGPNGVIRYGNTVECY
jgi:hypothetical protein